MHLSYNKFEAISHWITLFLVIWSTRKLSTQAYRMSITFTFLHDRKESDFNIDTNQNHQKKNEF